MNLLQKKTVSGRAFEYLLIRVAIRFGTEAKAKTDKEIIYCWNEKVREVRAWHFRSSQNAERRTQNAERRTQNAERRTTIFEKVGIHDLQTCKTQLQERNCRRHLWAATYTSTYLVELTLRQIETPLASLNQLSRFFIHGDCIIDVVAVLHRLNYGLYSLHRIRVFRECSVRHHATEYTAASRDRLNRDDHYSACSQNAQLFAFPRL